MPNFARHSFGTDQILRGWKLRQEQQGIEEDKIREQIMLDAQNGMLVQNLTSNPVYRKFAQKYPSYVQTGMAVEMKAKRQAEQDQIVLKSRKLDTLINIYGKQYENMPDKSRAMMASELDKLLSETTGVAGSFRNSADFDTSKKELSQTMVKKAAEMIEGLGAETKNLTGLGTKIREQLSFAKTHGNAETKEYVEYLEEKFNEQRKSIVDRQTKAADQQRQLEASRQGIIDNTDVEVVDKSNPDAPPRVMANAAAQNLVKAGKGRFEISAQGTPKKQEAKKYEALGEAYGTGWFPSRRMSVGEMDAMEAGLQQRKAAGLPIDAETLREMEFATLKNASTGRSAGSRLVVARKQNIQASFELLDDLETTGSKLDYSNARFAGVLEKFTKGQLNDPTLTEYMTQRADALFVLGNALKQNGLTDKSIEVEEEAANPTMSPRTLKAWLNVQRRALNRAATELNEDYKYDIEGAGTVPAGQGGVGKKTPYGETKGGGNDFSKMSDEELLKALGE